MTCTCGVVPFSSVVIVSSFVLLVTSFNLDSVNYVQHTGPSESMFGFAVATHREHGNSWVLVGAPTAQGQLSRIHRGGVVFKCNTTVDGPCQEVDFHGERGGDLFKTPDDKSNQWFGATLQSSGADGPVVACAPRYVWFTQSREERRDPVGTCYIGRDDFRKVSEYSPCRTSLFGYHRQGSCQAGFSAGISKDGRRLFVGAPGSWYWQGQMYSIDPSVKFPYTPGIFGEAFGFGVKGQVIQQSLDDRPAVMSTPEGPAKDDDSYMGYSMIVGDFNGEGVQGVAVGMPKGGDMLEGKVLLYTWSLTNYLNITGEQLGAYFGYSLAAVDVDGDGRDDVIIGAPMHTQPNNELKYEVGRVYVAYQSLNSNYAKREYLDGFNSKSRFGLAVSTCGDLNLDGYGDFAVGAPYDGPKERGAVYIFQGSANGVIKKYSQVIYAEDVYGSSFNSLNPLSTFGFSLSGGLDLDRNDYPDLAVGAYSSNAAFFFRARPVVRVEAIVRFDEPKTIRLDRKSCNKPSKPSVKVACTGLQVCLSYTGIGAPSVISLNLEYLLDSRKPYSRIYMDRDSGKTYRTTVDLYKDAPMNCDPRLQHTVYLQESIADKLTDIEVEVKYSLNYGSSQTIHQRNPRGNLIPIVDLSKPAVVNDTIIIYKNCGPDNICIPDLHLFVEKAVTKYLYDAEKPLEFDVKITNTKDDSYNTKFYVHLPEGIEFRGAPLVDNSQFENKLACSPTYNQSIFACDIGNPLASNTGVHFKLRVAPIRHQRLLKPTYVFYMNATSANPEQFGTTLDNSVEITVDIWVDAVLAIEGKSSPSNVYYNLSQYNLITQAKWDSEIGPPVIHSYTVTNKGPSDVEALELYIIWPAKTLSGEDLLYLLEPPHTLGGLECREVDANYKEYALALQRDVWDTINIYKESNGTQGGSGVETGHPVPGKTGNSITQTITVFTLLGRNKQYLEEITVIGEQTLEEYWKNVSIACSRFSGHGPLTLIGNSSSLIKEYDIYGRQISSKIVSRPQGPELYTSFNVNSNVSTVVTYYDYASPNKILFSEYIYEEPESYTFKNQIERTKARLRTPVLIQTNTTRNFEFISLDGKVLYQYTITQAKTGTDAQSPTEYVSLTTYVTFYDINGKELKQEIVNNEPNSTEFWTHINKITSSYHEPIKIETNTIKEITYILNGREIRKEKQPFESASLKRPLTAYSKSVTTLKVTNSNGVILHEGKIPGEKGSSIYNDNFKNILNRFKEPVTLETKTVYTITYTNEEGNTLLTSTYTEIITETYNPDTIDITRTDTITTVIIYDVYRNILHQENVTETVGSNAFWEKINALIGKYPKQQEVRVTTRKIIIHYVNGQEVASEQQPTGSSETFYRPQTSVTTKIVVLNQHGIILHEQEWPGRKDSIEDIASKYSGEPITIELKTVYRINYYTSDGRLTHTGTLTETRTETRAPQETTSTKIVTTVILLDDNRNVIHQENITETVGSEAYWTKINAIINTYQQQKVTIQINTRTIVTFYVNGQEVRTKEIPGPSGPTENLYTSQTTTSTRIIVRNLHGRIIFDESFAEKRDSFQDILQRFNEPARIEIITIYTTIYRDSTGKEVYTGTQSESKTESYTPQPNQQSKQTTITTLVFYDLSGRVITQEDIIDEPRSSAYWDKINKIITKYHRQHQEITIQVRTRTKITYYQNGIAIQEEEIHTPGAAEQQLIPRTVVSTTVTVYNAHRRTLFEGSIPGEKGTSEYNTYIDSIVSKYREPITVITRTTYTISYYSEGVVTHRGTDYSEETQTYHQQQQGTTQTNTITTIIFYGPHNNILHQETIHEEPKSQLFWEHIKEAIAKFNVPITIHTNSTRVITHYVNGVPTHTERTPGVALAPFTSQVEIVNVITFYNAHKQKIHEETVRGELHPDDRGRRIADFTRRYSGSFTMETNTTKTITYLTLNGNFLYRDNIFSLPDKPNLTRTVTETTFTVYGPDGRSVLHQETIEGETGSTAYNNVIANIVGRYTGSITIHTNSTKTIYFSSGKTKQTIPEFRSTVQRQDDGVSRGAARTLITFYGPDGQTLHHDTIESAHGGRSFIDQLNDIAREYGGVVKSYGGTLNEDGSISGPVTVVDTPYPGNRPRPVGSHFTEFDGSSQGSSDHMRSGGLDLGSFARGKGFRTGGIDLGVSHGGNENRSVENRARNNFETYSYDGSSNHLSGVQTYQYDGSPIHTTARYGRKKRDATDDYITQLSNCTTRNCVAIKCVTTKPVVKGHEIHIALRARVVVQTLKNISMTQPVNIQSMLLARISHFQEISGSPAQRTLYRHQVVTQVVAPEPDVKPDIVPLWVVILSAVAGTLILLLLIFLLHKCGFFKRNRPSNAPERQPLNRNGHFQHGDEAL